MKYRWWGLWMLHQSVMHGSAAHKEPSEWPPIVVVAATWTIIVHLRWHPALCLQCHSNLTLLGWLGPKTSYWPWIYFVAQIFLSLLDAWYETTPYVGLLRAALPTCSFLPIFQVMVTSDLYQSHNLLHLSALLPIVEHRSLPGPCHQPPPSSSLLPVPSWAWNPPFCAMQ